jgi:hypothetical protein
MERFGIIRQIRIQAIQGPCGHKPPVAGGQKPCNRYALATIFLPPASHVTALFLK